MNTMTTRQLQLVLEKQYNAAKDKAIQSLICSTIDAVRNAGTERENAAYKMLTLKTRMERCVTALTEQVDPTINSLGEVQGFGSDVDRACSAYALAKNNAMNHLRMLSKFVELNIGDLADLTIDYRTQA